MSELSCPSCGMSNVININLNTDDGDPLEFYSCHECDHRWWYKDGMAVELGEVLELSKRAPRRPGRTPRS